MTSSVCAAPRGSGPHQHLLKAESAASKFAREQSAGRIAPQDGMALVQIAILFMTSSPVTPWMTPAPSRCKEALVICVIQSVVDLSASSEADSPLIRKNPFKSPPCASRNTISNV